MPRQAKPLSDARIQGLAKGAKLTDGTTKGLIVHCLPDGRRAWRLRYLQVDTKKPTMIHLGNYPGLTLAGARTKAVECLAALSRGVDPKTVITETQKQIAEINKAAIDKVLFKAVVKQFLEDKALLRSNSTLKTTTIRINKHLLPYFGEKPIDEIEMIELQTRLREIYNITPDTSFKVRQILNGIFFTAKRYKYRIDDPMQDIKQENVGIVEDNNHPAIIDPKPYGKMIREIKLYKSPITKIAMLLSAHTVVRMESLLGAKWEQFDLENNIWTIPVSNLKGKHDKAHKIEPLKIHLSKQVLNILNELKGHTGEFEYLFPSSKGNKPISNGTIPTAFEAMGYKGKHTHHGFRASFKTMCLEQLFVPESYIESHLGHKTKSSHGTAYDRATYTDVKKVLMQYWSDYIDILTANKTEEKPSVENWFDYFKKCVPQPK